MRIPPRPKTIRAIGFDDAPFAHARGSQVPIVGVVCAATRFEGMVVGRVRKDGWTANAEIARLLVGGKFLPQVHVVLVDGLAFGGLNVIDLAALAATLDRPCLAVMRRRPDLAAMERAIRRLPRPDARLRALAAAGEIHESPPFFFQARGCSRDVAADALARLTDRGHVPEALRLAHLVGRAIVSGESGRNA